MDVVAADPPSAAGTATNGKTNQNTVVVISPSTTRRPAAEARKRRKEILNKQNKPTKSGITDDVENVVESYNVAPSVQLTENLVAVAAAAAAAGAVLDLGSSDDVMSTTESNLAAVDIPFLDDAAIAATAAAVAMNSNSTTANDMGNQRHENGRIVGLRKSLGGLKRPRKESDDIDRDDESEKEDILATDEMKRDSNNKKTQIRYDPSIPMEKEQLAAWRREARRVRNRESAAASRQRIRGRIAELEDEINDWKQKYHDALVQLAQCQKQQDSSAK